MALRIFIVGNKETAPRLPVFQGKKALFRRVRGCASGEEAIRQLRTRRVDVVLVDFHLPCMDGFESVRKLRRLLPDVPIFMSMTGERTHDDDLIFSALHAGANGYFPAQLPASELAWAIVQAHRAARQHRPVFMLFCEGDRHLSRSARHWHKLTTMLNASTVDLSYGKVWRRVVVLMRNKVTPVETLVPSLMLPGHVLAAA